MNKEEIKQQHPTVYAEILSEGVLQEKERVASWEIFRGVDSKAVAEGIESGLAIKQSQTSAFLLKATQMSKVDDLKSDNAPDLATNETAILDNSESVSKAKEIEEAFNF